MIYLYTTQGYAAEHEVSTGEEKILMRLSWPAIEALLGEHFPRYVLLETAMKYVLEFSKCVHGGHTTTATPSEYDTRLRLPRERQPSCRQRSLRKPIPFAFADCPRRRITGPRSRSPVCRHYYADALREG